LPSVASASAESSPRYGAGVDGEADIAAVGALLADRARTRMLVTLTDGRALPASVLAAEAGVAASTASEHLRKLLDGGMLSVERHGRHRYYRLAGPQVARLLEALAEQAPATQIRSLREGTRAHALRRARYCYDHLAGRLGVALMGTLLDRGALVGGDGRFDPRRAKVDRLSAPAQDIDYRLTAAGAQLFADLGVDVDELSRGRRPLVRYCVDWSEQRHHLAGALGAGLARRLFDLGWIERGRHPRAVRITGAGADGLEAAFGIDVPDHTSYSDANR
jgi:DNA-binding transcriptional ArsR family regulator